MNIEKQYDYTVFIGRFQPFHYHHKYVIDQALERSKTVLVCIGSAQYSRRLRNPFSFDERVEMITACYPNEARIQFVPIDDYTYQDDRWTAHVQQQVEEAISFDGWTDKPPSVALIGCKKDNTGYFLSMFPQWDSIDVKHNKGFIHATDIRNKLYGDSWSWTGFPSVPQPVVDKLLHHYNQPWFANLREEYSFVQKYIKMWSVAPFPVTFNAVDAVVVQSGHILLVKRKGVPGKGKLALPGGFLDITETLYDSAIRELREETQIKLSDFSLKAAYKGCKTFDDPHRSERGRMITTAFMFRLENRPFLPPVEGADDADKDGTGWYKLADIKANDMFNDHYHIIQSMMGNF